jgi:hypothetical protein
MCHHSTCCGGDGLSRREFLVSAAGTAGATLAGGWMLRTATALETQQTSQS